jgi:hypothetical protein
MPRPVITSPVRKSVATRAGLTLESMGAQRIQPPESFFARFSSAAWYPYQSTQP